MPAPTLNRIPRTVEEWKTEAEKFGVETSSINHQENVSSASKFGDGHFLMLRAIWPLCWKTQRQDKPWEAFVSHDYLAKAKARLRTDNDKEWKSYLAKVHVTVSTFRHSGDSGVGRFHIPLRLLAQMNNNKNSDLPDDYTLPNLRPRPREKNDAMTSPRPRSNSPTQPSSTGASKDADFQSSSATKDSFGEEVPTTFIWSLLSCNVDTKVDIQVDWKLTQRVFRVPYKGNKVWNEKEKKWKNKRWAYESRVDGTGEIWGSNAVLSVLEVKKRQRMQGKCNPDLSIIKQESAEMAAWIATHPPADWQTALKKGKTDKFM